MQLRDMQGEDMDRMARERQSLADPELHQEEAEFPKTILDYFIYFYFFIYLPVEICYILPNFFTTFLGIIGMGKLH